MASCITYARSHRVKSGVGAGYGLFTSFGKWVVNSGKNGTKSKVEIHECVHDQNDKLHVLGGANWDRSPQGESPKCYSRLYMNPGDVSS